VIEVGEEEAGEEVDSPMVVVEAIEERQQWRVPPIHTNNLTVDIFSEPEYFQVSLHVRFIVQRRHL
jgi:hypothetical protein